MHTWSNRRHRWFTLCFIVFAMLTGFAGSGRAETRVIYPQQEAGMTQFADYYFVLMQTALEKTRAKYGDFKLSYMVHAMNRARAELELSTEHGRIDTSVFGWTAEREEKFYQVRVPLDRGLIGYRVLLIRKADQEKFNSVRTLDDLKKFRFGLLDSWSDVTILQHNKLTVIPGNNFDGLFKMLDIGRFDAFSRDISEIQRELERHSNELPNLAIENTLLLRYPSARYFFVKKTPAGLQLRTRVEAGLEMMKKDGSLDALFIKYRSEEIGKFKFNKRHIIELANPNSPPDADKLPKDLIPTAKSRRH
jgi:ABC-type amino acid transport substrate-binding protein